MNRYLNIQEFMLQLPVDNSRELQAYAIVYGFSQDGRSSFFGSISYFEKWLMCTRKTAIKTLKSLEDKGLVEKIQVVDENGVPHNTYRVVMEVVEKLHYGVVEKLPEGSGIITPNNNNINNNINIQASAAEKNEHPDASWFKKYDLTYQQRVKLFKERVREEAKGGAYDRQMLIDFFEYWTEPSMDKNAKLKAETNKTWDTKLRLSRWKRSPYNKQNPKPNDRI